MVAEAAKLDSIYSPLAGPGNRDFDLAGVKWSALKSHPPPLCHSSLGIMMSAVL